MKALTYHGARDVRLDEVDEPRIEAADDVVIRITATAICMAELRAVRPSACGCRRRNVGPLLVPDNLDDNEVHDIAHGYMLFNDKKDACRKVVLHPN